MRKKQLFIHMSNVPNQHYGVLLENSSNTTIDNAVDGIKRLGYAVFDPKLSDSAINEIQTAFDSLHHAYQSTWGVSFLDERDELNTIRSPLVQHPVFLELATNKKLLSLVSKLIKGTFILNQQNGIINPPNQTYNQALWHRDLPYQHFISSTPLAINALFCVDDFTEENGATFVLPASHKEAALPSDPFIQKHALQIEAKAGQFIILDCMAFHAGGFNQTSLPRRAINHMFTIPYFKQQVNLKNEIDRHSLDNTTARLLGFDYQEPASIQEYLLKRPIKTSIK